MCSAEELETLYMRGHKAIDNVTRSIAWRREMQKRKLLTIYCKKTKRGHPLSLARFPRQNIFERRRGAHAG